MRKRLFTLTVLISSFASSAMDGHDANAHPLYIQNAQTGVKISARSLVHFDARYKNIIVANDTPISESSINQPNVQISGMRIVGQPVLVFDHLEDRIEPNHLPDA